MDGRLFSVHGRAYQDYDRVCGGHEHRGQNGERNLHRGSGAPGKKRTYNCNLYPAFAGHAWIIGAVEVVEACLSVGRKWTFFSDPPR